MSKNLTEHPKKQSNPGLEASLKRRGLKVFMANPDYGLLPAALSSEEKSQFYDLMKKYSFRLVLREIIQRPKGFSLTELTKYSGPSVVQEYLDFLCACSLISHTCDSFYALNVQPIYSFGLTLEWFVFELFKREFKCEAIYGVRFREAPAGGDYDVITLWEGKLIYTEIKSSPPKGIEISEVKAFFNRIDDLMPHIAIFFNDTELRMKDKIVPLFEEELDRRYGSGAKYRFPVSRMIRELFHINHTVFIINSKKSISSNIMTCIRDYLNLEKRLSGPW